MSDPWSGTDPCVGMHDLLQILWTRGEAGIARASNSIKLGVHGTRRIRENRQHGHLIHVRTTLPEYYQ